MAKDGNQKPDSKLTPFQLGFTGKWKPALDGTQLAEGDMQILTNMRYTSAPGIKSISGMTKINTTPIATYLKLKSGFHFTKDKPSESHLLVQGFNAAESQAVLYQNTTAIPSAGAFSGTAVYTDTAGSSPATWSLAPDGCIIYNNAKESCVWGGAECRCAGFILRSPSGAATGTLTSDTVIPTDADTVTIDTKVYTFKTALTPTEGEVLIGGSAAIALDNLKSAINHTGTPDTDYKCAAVHPTVTATTNTDTTQIVVAKTAGSAGNAIATTEASTHLAWGGTVLSGGTDEGASYLIDYTNQINNTLEDALNVATLNSDPSYVYIGSVRPIKGVKFYLGTANDTTATVAVKYWNSSGAWASVSSLVDGTASDGKTLAIDGEITFTDGSSTGWDNAKPKFINDTYIYWYQFVFTGINTATTVGYVTLNAPMQPILDLWDGNQRPISSLFVNVTDRTLNALSLDYLETSAITYLQLDSLSTASSLSIGFTERMTGLGFNMGGAEVNSNVATMTIRYWNGTTWTTVSGLADETSLNGVSFAQSGKVTWTVPAENTEFPTSIGGGPLLYYYKVTFSAILDASVDVDCVYGCSAQRVIKAYKLSANWQNRVILVGEVAGYKNSILIGATGSVCVFNGDDSLDIYSIGDDSLPTAVGSIFTRYTGAFYDTLIICKKNETWILDGTDVATYRLFRVSNLYGCVAPDTFKVFPTSYELTPGINRHIAIWQSASGMVLFDGNTVVPISDDISNYFDLNNSDCINSTYLDISTSFVDEREQEYHWIFASGTSATGLNTELVYNINRKAWYKVDRGVTLQCGIPVRDTKGNAHTYGGLATGYVERLEYGNTFDGTAITSTVKTRDFIFNNWLTSSLIRFFKLIFKSKTTTGRVTVTHFADINTSGDSITISCNPNSSTQRVVQIKEGTSWGANVFHALQLSLATSDQSTALEPVGIAGFWQFVREDT